MPRNHHSKEKSSPLLEEPEPRSFLFRLGRRVRDKLPRKFVRAFNKGSLKDDPKVSDLLKSLEKLHQKRLEELMVPRAEMVALDCNLSFEILLKTIDLHMYSRYPVFRGDLDRIVGCIETKDIMRTMREAKHPTTTMLRKYFRKVHFTSASKLASHLLLELRDKKRHLAIIVDEHGGVDGMITVEDLAAEIVGFYEDAYDNEELVAALPEIDDGRVSVPARLSIDDFENHYGWTINQGDLDDERPDTIGGRIVALAERVPSQGEVIADTHNHLEYVILEANPRRVYRIEVRHTGLEAGHL